MISLYSNNSKRMQGNPDKGSDNLARESISSDIPRNGKRISFILFPRNKASKNKTLYE